MIFGMRASRRMGDITWHDLSHQRYFCRERKMNRYGLIVALLSLLLAACSGTRNYSDGEAFRSDSRYSRDFSVAPVPVCEAARRVLLRDGYIVDAGAGERITGAKEFQVDDNQQAQLRLYVNCSARALGSTLFVTATEEHFDIKTSRKSTSLGIPLLFPISVSNSSEVDAQVKVRGEMVRDKDFYERFYRGVNQELAR
jgi:hypothetical protein